MTSLESLDDHVAAGAFRKLVQHLRHRTDAQNIDLMGLSGFCRNCLSEWVEEAAGGTLTREQAREAVYGMPYADWKAMHVGDATPEQLDRMAASLEKNEGRGF